MADINLFEIQAADEFKTTVAEPTPWLQSLPPAEQARRVKTYLRDLQVEYDEVADATERARIAILMGAAREYLKKLGAGR